MKSNTRHLTAWTIGLAAVFSVLFASSARASCFDRPLQRAIGAPRLQHNGSNAPGLADRDLDSIVGMWAVDFFDGTGALWDQGFELFHADGTELNVDNGVPPVLGNVCVGVWELVGPRAIKLRHMTWNWNPDGTKAGTFLLLMTVRLDRHGRAYSGRFVADSFDLDGHLIDSAHVEGTVEAKRITVD
jgi:hypothetical protein